MATNAGKPSREQLTLICMFEERTWLRGATMRCGRYARRWSKEPGQAHGQATAAAYVPLTFAPGEAYQFDWSHEVVLLSGVTVIVAVAHILSVKPRSRPPRATRKSLRACVRLLRVLPSLPP